MAATPDLRENRRTPVYGLDLVRFAAAALVVVYHLGFKAWAVPGSNLHAVLGMTLERPPGYRWTWLGWIGVQVFFVMSGAVIAYSADGARARDFARRRVERLWPALLIAVAIALPVTFTVFAAPPGEAAWLALKTIVLAPYGPWLIGQFWTIPIEMSFYALVCATLAARVGRQGMDALPWALGLVSCAYWLAAALGWHAGGGRFSELLLLQHGVYFAIGMLCARLGESRWTRSQTILAVACMAAAAQQVRVAAGWEMAAYPNLAGFWPWAYGLWLGLTAIIALSFLHRDRVGRYLSGCGGQVRLLGLSTYPLYLIHIHVGGAILVSTRGLGVPGSVACACAVSLAASLAIARWAEPPLHRKLRSILAQMERRAGGASARA